MTVSPAALVYSIGAAINAGSGRTFMTAKPSQVIPNPTWRGTPNGQSQAGGRTAVRPYELCANARISLRTFPSAVSGPPASNRRSRGHTHPPRETPPAGPGAATCRPVWSARRSSIPRRHSIGRRCVAGTQARRSINARNIAAAIAMSLADCVKDGHPILVQDFQDLLAAVD